MYTDSFLVRTLRARDQDVKLAYKMFTDYLQYREENNLENIASFKLKNYDEIHKHFPHGYHKTDKFGRPIYIEIMGDLNADKVFELASDEDLIKVAVQDYELLYRKKFPICSEIRNEYIGQIFMIIDLKGLTMSLLSSKVRSFMKLKSEVDQTYYPEKVGQIYIINTSFWFKAAWAVVKYFIAERTRKKITTLGSSYTEQLLEIIDKENLPKILGGECECKEGCLKSDAGPWNLDKYCSDNIIYKKYT